VQSHDGKVVQRCVPKALQDPVRQAVAGYQEMQRLISEVSELEWKRFLAGKA
jgi:UDP-N-acetyl-D-mannosaminuronic acid transferase (WecB/TagA/CpsF family)